MLIYILSGIANNTLENELFYNSMTIFILLGIFSYIFNAIRLMNCGNSNTFIVICSRQSILLLLSHYLQIM